MDFFKRNFAIFRRKFSGGKWALKCGSIIKFNLSTISSEPIYAIVLDRGVLGTDIDLLVETESIAYKSVGRRKITYEVVRSGY